MTPPSLRTVRRLQAGEHFEAELHLPVAVLGGGACGLVTALALHDLGVESVVLERDAVPAGSTALSSGLVPAAGTRVQRASGVHDDSAERFAADIQAKAKGRAEPQLVRAYTQAAGAALDGLEARHGIAWTLLDNFLYPGHSVHRMHGLPERSGSALMAGLQRAAESAGVPVLTRALVDTLWIDADGERIVGIEWQRPDGTRERLGCDLLVLACNGFGGNASMVRALLPEMAAASFGGHVGNDGSAIRWGEALGARLRDLGGYQGHGSWVTPQGALMSWAVMMEGGIQVNRDGRRFHDETQGYSEAAVHVLAQPGQIAWNLLDTPLLALAREFPDFREAEAAGAVRSAASIDSLADTIGCDPATLQATLAAVQPDTAGPDGRLFRRALQPPYVAVKVTGALFHTQGGLDVSPDMRVLRQDGTPFANLLAAGGAAGGVSGDAVWGYLSGNGLLSAVAGGWIAAHTAAALERMPATTQPDANLKETSA